MNIEVERIEPDPTEDEAAAIAAFLEYALPVALPDGSAQSTPTWRFSGRWWAKPVAARRDRPWF